MLQEVQGITPSAAAGIRDEYESFQVLMEAYERAEKRGGRERAEGLLQGCQVRRVALPRPPSNVMARRGRWSSREKVLTGEQIKNLRNGVASGRKLNKVGFRIQIGSAPKLTLRHCLNAYITSFEDKIVSPLCDLIPIFSSWSFCSRPTPPSLIITHPSTWGLPKNDTPNVVF